MSNHLALCPLAISVGRVGLSRSSCKSVAQVGLSRQRLADCGHDHTHKGGNYYGDANNVQMLVHDFPLTLRAAKLQSRIYYCDVLGNHTMFVLCRQKRIADNVRRSVWADRSVGWPSG